MAGAGGIEIIKCPDCNGGSRNQKVEFRQGTVGTSGSAPKEEDECPRCKGDGLILRPNPKDPMT